MPTPMTAPYGSWRSPLTAAMLTQSAVGLSQLLVSGDDVYWNERRPAEAGRNVVVVSRRGAPPQDLIPAPWSARTLVHEYGGMCYAVAGEDAWFSNFVDQRLWRVRPGEEPQPLTAEPDEARSVRFADPVVHPDRTWLVCVRERHAGGQVANEVVAVSLTDPPGNAREVVLASGHDFYSFPRLSPDGTRMAWVSWDHPRMPWDGTELWVAGLAMSDGVPLVGSAELVAGGPEESVGQPRWNPSSELHYVSDRSGWWNIYSESGVAVAPMEAEFAQPDWAFGQSSYTFTADGALVATWMADGIHHIGPISRGRARALPFGYTHFDSLQPDPEGGVMALAASPTAAAALVRLPLDGSAPVVVKASRPALIEDAYLSRAEPVEFPSSDGRVAHALFYPPVNPDFEAPAGELPPLVVLSHGGPTGATEAVLNPAIQYLTTRGLAVVDVNYGGSTGYGRAYREQLAGAWGVVDVDDCVNAALHLVEQGRVDGSRLAIRGGSAGGYTTLASLAFRDTFAVGASLFGVADLALLARDTHKFESRYLDKLVGPYPEREDLYRQRSPLYAADRIDCPVIFFQGLEDAVVPPAQSELMVEALRGRGIPVAYLTFEGEQHGFRQAETIIRVAEAELDFYGRVLGFQPADEIEPVKIENEERLRSG